MKVSGTASAGGLEDMNEKVELSLHPEKPRRPCPAMMILGGEDKEENACRILK